MRKDLLMRIRRTEEVGDVTVEVFLEDWPREDESQEQFEERMVRLTDRLTSLKIGEAKEPTDDAS